MSRNWIGAIGLLVAAVLLPACSNNTTAPSTTSIVVTGTTTLTAVGQTSQLTASQASTGGSSQTVTTLATWSSSDATIATVSTGGLVTAVAQGAAIITASYQGQSGTLTVVVSPPVPITGPATYVYTGTTLTMFSGGYACPPQCQITGSFTVGAPLAASLVSSSLTIRSFTFTDGSTTVTQANGQIVRALISTDVNGQIVLPWVIEVQTTTPTGSVMLWTINQLQTQGGASDGSQFVSGATGSGSNLISPGFWVQQ
jgi:hypothetical protein